ncbi:hypothetical protein OH77DRAFT_1588439 [Trametes cingulata]|nr:hypothetical protein OH77DRAFT_1588439 [Trametes cingulata]
MDGNNHPDNGFLSHILDPHLGQVFNGLVRSLLPQHDQQQQPPANAPAQETNIADMPPPEPATAPLREEAVELRSATQSEGASAPSTPPPDASATSHGDVRDVEMLSSAEAESSDASSSRPQIVPRNSRRARVEEEDDDDEDYWRESNRQRMHSPTPHDDERHHFMPIPEDHAVPQQAAEANAQPQPAADAHRDAPRAGPQPPQGRMMWTFDFLPIHPQEHPAPGNAQPEEAAHHDQNNRHDHEHRQDHRDQIPTLNLFINIPIPAHGAHAQPAAANAHGNVAPTYVFHPYFYPAPTDGAHAPQNAAFTFPFPFGTFGMDMMEERDDPERAQRLVDGLEEVPVGLVKRMERVGGPGTAQGEAPTCAVCWESLLEPEGGGFEGNAELAKAEAAEAAREDAASQQERESSMDLDSPTTAPAGESSTSSSASSSTTPSLSHGEGKYPKIVVLPCSHVFHASCLLPWFSKPGRTTCPSCRFDIDPDSLTYTPRPLRARRPEPQPVPQPAPASAAAPQPQQPPIFGPAPPPPYAAAAPQPAPVSSATAQAAPNVPGEAPAAAAGVQPQGGAPEGQPRQQHPPLPPFITFDISMIIPVFPGRPAASAQPAPGAQAADAGAGINAQGAAPQPQPQPQPPRTDNNGFRLDDPVLTEAVRSTFERIFGRPAPPPRTQTQQPAAGAPAPGENAPRDVPLDWYTFAGPLPGFPPVPPMNANARRGAPQRPAPKRKWTLPPPPGPTLRQLVERNEREMGLRCSDVSCGLGPSDDDPISTFDTSALRQISIRPLKSDASGKEAVCEHKFHPSCLVSAERVAGWGGEDRKEERENEGEGEDVEVSCPVCRAVGVISRLDWEEGACALA